MFWVTRRAVWTALARGHLVPRAHHDCAVRQLHQLALSSPRERCRAAGWLVAAPAVTARENAQKLSWLLDVGRRAADDNGTSKGRAGRVLPQHDAISRAHQEPAL